MPAISRQFKSSVKQTAAQLLSGSGVLDWITAVRLRRAIAVLMYHRVLPEGADTCSTPAICVTPQTFERQLRLLKRHFTVLSLQEVMAVLAGTTPLPTRPCVVTFDDGWQDNYSHAFPIIRALDIPVTIFVATDFIDSGTCFWQERLTRLLLAARERRSLVCVAIDEKRAQDIYAMGDKAARMEIVHAVRQLKKLPHGDIETLIRELGQRLAEQGVDAENCGDDRFMSWDEIRTLCENARIEIGSHLCSHIPMPLMPAERIRAELIESKRKIAAETGRPVQAVAYPNGDYTEQALVLAREAGYSLGFSVESGYLHRADDPFRVRRINISQTGTDTDAGFLTRLARLF